MERVALDGSVLGLAAFTANVEGRDFIAERIDSTMDVASEKFVYRTGVDESLSTLTKFADGTVLGKVFVAGRGYFIAPEGDHYVVVRSTLLHFSEIVHYPLVEGGAAVTSNATPRGKRRAVRFPSPPAPVFRIVVAMDNDYAVAVGGREKAIQRATHYRDRQNTAYQQSGFEGRIEVTEYAFFDLPRDLDGERSVYTWAVRGGNSVIRDIRKRSKAAAVLIFTESHFGNEATRTAPAPINADFEIAISGGYLANSLVDDDMLVAEHEVGHLSGGDHNIESVNNPNDPQAAARDWYDCDASVHGALSYNVCGKFLDFGEVYSGTNAFWGGKVRGVAGVNDNVGTFRQVFPFLVGEHE
jgi:hypothetical protein